MAGSGGSPLATLIVAYADATSVLQRAYQRGGALTAAGMATNAVPVAAGFVLFGETPPGDAGRLAGRGVRVPGERCRA